MHFYVSFFILIKNCKISDGLREEHRQGKVKGSELQTPNAVLLSYTGYLSSGRSVLRWTMGDLRFSMVSHK